MVVYSFYIFDRHASCIYKKTYTAARPPSSSSTTTTSTLNTAPGGGGGGGGAPPTTTATMAASTTAAGVARELSAEDNAKLVFGTVFSLRNMVRKLGGADDSFVSYRTSHYKLHFYETPTSLKFVMVTDTRVNNLRIVLHQIYVSLYVEYVVKNPLAPAELAPGESVDCELFEAGLEQFLSTMGLHG